MAEKVNLDALMPREDFEVFETDNPASQISTFSIRDLEPNAFFCRQIRKPDFQRETNEWSIDTVKQFLKSFLDGDLIPAIILWNSGNYVFVIDGAHRIGALIAWVNDDYGDGRTSKLFFDSLIPAEQTAVAEKTRRAINREIGSYEDHKLALEHPTKVKPEVVQRAKTLATVALQTQWVKGDAEKAEASFCKINQQAAPIDKTELRLLQARTKPNAIAARAIIRSGTGHKYWSRFGEENQKEIEEIARDIHTALFTPKLKTPIKTLDLPAAGRGYSAKTLPLVFDFVNLANDVKADKAVSIDSDGQSTIQYLKKCRKIINRISGTHPSSLGLHPIVYFYSSSGRYQPTAFLATVELIKEFEVANRFKEFTDVRAEFEEFHLRNKHLVKQIQYKHGSGLKGYSTLLNLFQFVINKLISGSSEDQIREEITKEPKFSFLRLDERDEVATVSSSFSAATKSATFLKEALTNPIKCSICGGLLHTESITFDHKQRKSEGGLGHMENAQLTHPYCNTTYKH